MPIEVPGSPPTRGQMLRSKVLCGIGRVQATRNALSVDQNEIRGEFAWGATTEGSIVDDLVVAWMSPPCFFAAAGRASHLLRDPSGLVRRLTCGAMFEPSWPQDAACLNRSGESRTPAIKLKAPLCSFR